MAGVLVQSYSEYAGMLKMDMQGRLASNLWGLGVRVRAHVLYYQWKWVIVGLLPTVPGIISVQ